MSARSVAAFVGIQKARIRLQELFDGLRDAASGAVVDRAAKKVQQQVDSVSKSKLSAHVHTGNALSSALTTQVGGLIQLNTTDYLRYHEWWPFRSGMPPFVVTRAIKIFEAELVAALGGQASPLALADEAAEAAASAKKAKKEASAKKTADRVAASQKRSQERKKKALARLERLKTRAADKIKKSSDRKRDRLNRAHDKRVKAREDRE